MGFFEGGRWLRGKGKASLRRNGCGRVWKGRREGFSTTKRVEKKPER